MGLENPIHIAIILIVILLVFGAKRLPEMGRSLGEGLRGFKETVSGDSPAPRIGSVHADADQPAQDSHEERTPLQPVA
jgi:sec-independent protein translocase protein TatA